VVGLEVVDAWAVGKSASGFAGSIYGSVVAAVFGFASPVAGSIVMSEKPAIFSPMR
jgi:hypothetical protein